MCHPFTAIAQCTEVRQRGKRVTAESPCSSQCIALQLGTGSCLIKGICDQCSWHFYLVPLTALWWNFEIRRAKFIVNSVRKLLEKEDGGAQWLHGLRQVPYPEASEALCTLPGVGPKVCRMKCTFPRCVCILQHPTLEVILRNSAAFLGGDANLVL